MNDKSALPRVYESDLPDVASCAALMPAAMVLVADPSAFDVVWAINPFMKPGSVDRAVAQHQWRALMGALSDAGLGVEVVPAVEGLCDLVFTANQSFPVRDGSGRVLLSRMFAAQRQPEVAEVAAAWTRLGRVVEPLPGEACFEAGGDALWFPGRRLILCGYGSRTQRPALDALARATGAPVVALELVDPRFYHLDTCLCPLDARCALVVPAAFSADGLARIAALFPEWVAVPEAEALRFACNGAVVGGRFLVQAGNPVSTAMAQARGLQVVELDTGEFIKSGGSVTCMTMQG
jgi:N-dimethylarginine dimethylaminohydrolase